MFNVKVSPNYEIVLLGGIEVVSQFLASYYVFRMGYIAAIVNGEKFSFIVNTQDCR